MSIASCPLLAVRTGTTNGGRSIASAIVWWRTEPVMRLENDYISTIVAAITSNVSEWTYIFTTSFVERLGGKDKAPLPYRVRGPPYATRIYLNKSLRNRWRGLRGNTKPQAESSVYCTRWPTIYRFNLTLTYPAQPHATNPKSVEKSSSVEWQKMNFYPQWLC